ncbi:MBL fold metallo-hydrolase [Muricoccus radiodurans]|uniref:MBL fold metallo-hydrolase n=1 Tax=Muricoccus radiodurans TaxID=2231721 RepID=UPI003CF4BEB0
MSDAQTSGSTSQAPGFYRFRIGAFEVVALHDGVVVRDRPAGFVRNASDEEVGEAFAALGMPRDKLTLTFTPLAIRTGNGVVLIDTGFGEGGPPGTGRTLSNLAAAGIAPEEVSTVLISHFHGDHIAGLRRKDGTPVYPKAEIAVPEPEWAFWMDDARMAVAPEGLKPNFGLVRQAFGPDAGSVRRFGWGDEVLPGFTAIQANGHTPGMTAFTIGSGNESMMFVADITNNPLIFARHPDWQAMFDMDPEQTIATRRRILDQAAADKMRVSFYHAPFPATGYILRNGSGYEFAPALWTNPAG